MATPAPIPNTVNVVASVDLTTTTIVGGQFLPIGAYTIEVRNTGSVPVTAHVALSCDGVRYAPAQAPELFNIEPGQTRHAFLPKDRPDYLEMTAEAEGGTGFVTVRLFLRAGR